MAGHAPIKISSGPIKASWYLQLLTILLFFCKDQTLSCVSELPFDPPPLCHRFADYLSQPAPLDFLSPHGVVERNATLSTNLSIVLLTRTFTLFKKFRVAPERRFNMAESGTRGIITFATAAVLTKPVPSTSFQCARRRARTPSMTLQPQDCSWQEERDRRAIESEFVVTVRNSGEVDNDMPMLRERMQMLGRKEKQWADVCQQFISLSILTGIPLIDPETGEPTARAWLFLSLSAAVPLYVLCIGAQWLHTTSSSFSHLL